MNLQDRPSLEQARENRSSVLGCVFLGIILVCLVLLLIAFQGITGVAL